MSYRGDSRTVEKIIADILDAASASAEIVSRGKDGRSEDRILRLAGEAVINRIGDAANKLPEDVRAAIPGVPWDDIRANRVLVAHIYHRIDYDILRATLAHDVPRLAAELERWRDRELGREAGAERESGPGLGP
ncbi:MAG TPA: HepT-like ribonuclease domain-containing protein [Kineosporiaceae bacterium]|nr:HepT-like ribonuclease domain-containing protein [Kineosporiaceae bacterium]